MFSPPKLIEWRSKRKIQWLYIEDITFIDSLQGKSFADKLRKFIVKFKEMRLVEIKQKEETKDVRLGD
jgi:hypothetical protein